MRLERASVSRALFATTLFQQSWPVVEFDVLDSTNRKAQELANLGELGPCWIRANRQTAGRGRMGRLWRSPEGNLYATALFAFPSTIMDATLVCFIAGLAVTDAINVLVPNLSATVRLKWPNDILAGQAKVSGVLIETGTHNGRLWMAVGCGVNLAVAPEGIDRPTISVAAMSGGTVIPPEEFLLELDKAFRARMTSLGEHGFEPSRTDWLARCAHIGSRISVPALGGQTEAAFVDLAPDGALVVRLDDGRTHHVRAGDVGVLG